VKFEHNQAIKNRIRLQRSSTVCASRRQTERTTHPQRLSTWLPTTFVSLARFLTLTSRHQKRLTSSPLHRKTPCTI